MQTEPPDGTQQQVPTTEVQVPLLGVPQLWDVEGGRTGNGDKVAFLKVTSPLNVAMLMLDKGAAEKLCEALRAQFSDITVVSPDALRLIRDADAAVRRP